MIPEHTPTFKAEEANVCHCTCFIKRRTSVSSIIACKVWLTEFAKSNPRAPSEGSQSTESSTLMTTVNIEMPTVQLTSLHANAQRVSTTFAASATKPTAAY